MARLRVLGENPPPPRGDGENQLRELRDYLTRLKDELEFLVTHLGEDNLDGDLAKHIRQIDAQAGEIEEIDTALAGKQDVLTFDNAPTSGSDNPVKSGGIYTALQGKQNTLTFDDAPASGSNNPVKSGGVYTALARKQDTLTFDDAPTSGSNNPVKSGGVYTALQTKVNPCLLDNWLFAGGGSHRGDGWFPINHRKQMLYSGTDYCIDRWKLVALTGGAPQAYLQDRNIRLRATGNSCYIQQRGVDWRSIAGKTVTYSILYEGGLATGSGTVPTSAPASGNITTIVLLNSQVPNGAGCGLYLNDGGICYAQVGQTVDHELEIIAVYLEVGEEQTFVRKKNNNWVLNTVPNFQEEQLKCATSKLDSLDGGYSGFNAVVGKVNNSGNPYIRFFMDNGHEYQFGLLSNGNLAIQEYDGSGWTTLRQYAPTS